MSIERKDYNNLAGDAIGIGTSEGKADERRADEAAAAMRRSEAVAERLEDAHWESLLGGGEG